MRHTLSFAIALSFFVSCSTRQDYSPDTYMSEQEKEKVTAYIIRYAGKTPPGANEHEKFSHKYDEYYERLASTARLEQYYSFKGKQYFLLSQPAPSLQEKRHATGGYFKLDEKDSLIEYEEVFRTWKMANDVLLKRANMLFDKMVKSESLEPYLSKNSNDIEYIEFPDDYVIFDKKQRKWVAK